MDNLEAWSYDYKKNTLFLLMLFLLCSILSKYHDFLFSFLSKIHIGSAPSHVVIRAICNNVGKLKNHLADYYLMNY